jgi:hypothetical protein
MTWEALDLIFFGFVLGMIVTLWVVRRPEKPPPEPPVVKSDQMR